MISTARSITLTRDQLDQLPLVVPHAHTRDFKPVQHKDLANTTVRVMQDMGFKIARESWHVNKTATMLIGSVDFKPNGVIAPLEIGVPGIHSLAVRHSNDGRHSITFGAGAKILLCDNGLFLAEFKESRRHTSNLDLQLFVEEALDSVTRECDTFKAKVEEFQLRTISNEQSYRILFDLFDAEALAFKYLQEVRAEWLRPHYREFHDRTLWSLYNACTYVVQTMSPPNQYDFFSKSLPVFRKEVLV